MKKKNLLSLLLVLTMLIGLASAMALTASAATVTESQYIDTPTTLPEGTVYTVALAPNDSTAVYATADVTGKNITFQNCLRTGSVTGKCTKSGTALLVYGSSTVSLENASFLNCGNSLTDSSSGQPTGEIDGGVVYVLGTLNLSGDTLFDGNTSSGEAIYGSLICNYGTININGPTVIKNSSDGGTKGAIYNDGKAVNLTSTLTLQTDTDTFCGELTLDVSGETTPGDTVCVNGVHRILDNSSLNIKVADDQPMGDYLIGTGDTATLINNLGYRVNVIDGQGNKKNLMIDQDPVIFKDKGYRLYTENNELHLEVAAEYTLLLQGGKAYKNTAAAGNEVTLPGLSYVAEESTWLMEDFSFASDEAVAVILSDKNLAVYGTTKIVSFYETTGTTPTYALKTTVAPEIYGLGSLSMTPGKSSGTSAPYYGYQAGGTMEYTDKDNNVFTWDKDSSVYKNTPRTAFFTQKAMLAQFGTGNQKYFDSFADAFAVDVSMTETPTNPTKLTLLQAVCENIEIAAGRNITVDLAGCSWAGYGYNSVVVNNGTLTLEDSSATKAGKLYGGHALCDLGGAVRLNQNSAFIMNGGTIMDCKAEKGGAVSVSYLSSFVMNGGTISGCSADYVGGAIYNLRGDVTLYGTIKNCTAKHYGGAIYNCTTDDGNYYASACIYMKDGSLIDNCSVSGGTDMFGGGIFNKGTVIMDEGAVIQNCKAVKGGGIHNDGNFYTRTVINGEVKNCTAEICGGGVQNSKGASLCVNNGKVTGNHAKTGFGGGVFTSGEFEIGTKAVIEKNTCGETEKVAGNVALVKGYPLNVFDASGTKIGITVIEKQQGVYQVAFGEFIEDTALSLNANYKRFKSDNASYGIDFVEGKAVFVDHPVSHCDYSAPFGTGEGVTLVFGTDEAPSLYTVKKSGSGYTVYDDVAGQYVAFADGSVILSNDAYVWKYDGSFYTEVKTQVEAHNRLFGMMRWLSKTVTNVVNRKYLSVSDGQLVTGEGVAVVTLVIHADEHTFAYVVKDTETHYAICAKCGETEVQSHEYDETLHTCPCGAHDPDACAITNVTVTEKTTRSIARGEKFWQLRTVTKYVYTVTATGYLTSPKSVEVDMGDGWQTGLIFTTSAKQSYFRIRVTDLNGDVTYWLYRDGLVTPETRQGPI